MSAVLPVGLGLFVHLRNALQLGWDGRAASSEGHDLALGHTVGAGQEKKEAETCIGAILSAKFALDKGNQCFCKAM